MSREYQAAYWRTQRRAKLTRIGQAEAELERLRTENEELREVGLQMASELGTYAAEVERLRSENAELREQRAVVENDLGAALLLNPFNDTRRILDLLTHALAIVQEPGAVHLHKKT